MQIQLISVTANKVPGKKYEKLEVAYKNDKGEIKGRNVMSFGIKEGLKLLKEASPGTMLDVDLVKEGEYWNWVGIRPAGSAPAATTSSATAPTKPSTYSGRDFESKEERAARQVLIVRQSCLANAIETLKTDKVSPPADAVLRLAQVYEQFVFGRDTNTEPEVKEDVAEVE